MSPIPLLRVSAQLVLASTLLLTGLANAQTTYKVLKGTIYDGAGGPLGRGVYWVKGKLTVPKGKTLTIRPHNGAAVLKFEGGGIDVYGKLELPDVGLSWSYFTSIRDDLIGGDTNGDRSATIPKPGDWSGIQFHWGSELSAGSNFHNSRFWYGGSDGRGMIYSGNFPATKLTLKNCRFHFGAGVGLHTGFSPVTASGTRIENCTGHAWTGQFAFLGNAVNNTATKNAKGDFIRRLGASAKWPQPDFAVGRAHTLNNSGVFVLGDSLRLASTDTLTVAEDTIFKLGKGHQIWSRGSVRLRGTKAKPIRITSLHDDTIGGDTEKNLCATKPAPGDHGGIKTFSKPLEMHGVDMRYGGYWGASVDLVETPATIEHCSLRDGTGHGVRCNTQPTTVQTITDTSFVRIQQNWITGITWNNLARCARNTASQGGVPIEVNPRMTATVLDITTANLIGPLLVLRASSHTPGNGSLTLHAGIHVKMSARTNFTSGFGQLRLLGTARDPIILTSIKDDSVDGDTNGDGNKTMPAAGDWSGVSFPRSTPVNRAEHVRIRYANWGVYVTSTTSELESVRADHCWSNGFYLQGSAKPMRNLIAYKCTKNGIYLNGGSSNIQHATVHACGTSGIEATPGYKGMVANSIAWQNTGGNFVGLPASKVMNSCGAHAGKNGNITKDPLFVNSANMLLKPNSPCLNAGNLQVGIATAKDFSENSRCNDHDFSGTALPDMGARERSAIGLAVNRSNPVLGQSQAFWTFADSSTTGVSIFLLGFEDVRFYLPPFGMENAGLQGLVVLGAQVIGRTISLPMPNDAKLVGIPFAVQALGLPTAKPGMGNFTNVYRGTIRS